MGESSKPKLEELSGPMEMSQVVGGQFIGVCLAQVCREDVEFIWQRARVVVRPRQENKRIFDIRVFDKGEAEALKIPVKDYTSLDTNPNLIYYEGWVENRPWPRSPRVDIEKKRIW